MIITHDEWVATGQRLPGRYGVAMDYATLTFRLLEDTILTPKQVTINGANGVVNVLPECDNPLYDLAAIQLLREYWLPDLFPIGTQTKFW